MTVSKAQAKATAKYEKKNYDRILVRLPKGTKDRMQKLGIASQNGFVVSLVMEKLKQLETDPEV